jgi:putative heme degradation protein
VARPEQIMQWRTQLANEPSSFARDLASLVLVELERAQLEAAKAYQRFSAMQAGIIRAQLSVVQPVCAACRDEALRRTEERMRLSGSVLPDATPGFPLPKVTPPRSS